MCVLRMQRRKDERADHLSTAGLGSPRSAMSSSVSVLVPVSLGPVQPDIAASSCCGLAADVGHKLLLLLFINWHLFYILKKRYW